ncbi:hypothetical protein [Klebsiella michiganensis]|uniref:hypothetical protein n=1 Tax=Klebsiella michiganensis TaxID=1134687 RepID=UPI0012BA2E4D|nr:hypothetical protein [Klebsiella michiganensis]
MSITLNVSTKKTFSYPNLVISGETVENVAVTFEYQGATLNRDSESSALFSTSIEGTESAGTIQVVFTLDETKGIQTQAEAALRDAFSAVSA